MQDFENQSQSTTDFQKEKLNFDLYPENCCSEDYFNRRIKSESVVKLLLWFFGFFFFIIIVVVLFVLYVLFVLFCFKSHFNSTALFRLFSSVLLPLLRQAVSRTLVSKQNVNSTLCTILEIFCAS